MVLSAQRSVPLFRHLVPSPPAVLLALAAGRTFTACTTAS